MFYWLENSVRRLRRYFSRSEWAIRHLCLPVSENTAHEPGLLLIQIDGLPRHEFERAVQKGRLPFLRMLMRRQHYKTHTFFSGVPSATPAVQAELFYGVHCAVPSFSFLDRASRRIATMYVPDWAKRIEREVQEKCHGGEPLLRGGSSWSNIYCGGAAEDESHFCAASIGPGKILKSAPLLGRIGLFALHSLIVVRLFVLLLIEMVLGLWDLARGVWYGQDLWKEVRFLFSRIFICIGVREIITAGAKIDLARGLPIIHVNFLGYDEQSHCRGPHSRYAHWSLRGIDKRIQQLYWAARRSARRDYQVWIFSDHGQEKVRSYEEKFPGGIEEAIAKALSEMQKKSKRPRRLQHRGSAAYWSGGLRSKLTFTEHLREEIFSAEEQESFSVTAMGPVANIYFSEKLSVEERRKLAEWLVRHAHVPSALLRTDAADVLWIHAQGHWHLPQDAETIFPHPGRMKTEVARDLVALCENNYAGDLVLLGWNPHGQNWSFPIEHGAHGGPGLHETQGFALLPPKTQLPAEARDYIRPIHLRKAALHFLGKERLAVVRKPRSSEMQHLRVMTYNVHGCLGLDGKISPHRIARTIETFEPDIVALQEIDLGRARSHRHDQSRMIAEHLGMHVVFCPVVVRDDELYGHALLSRLPMKVLRSGPFCCSEELPDFEPRGALLVELELEGMRLLLLNTHLGVGRYERAEQMTELLGPHWLGQIQIDEPLIVCGDFNMLPGSIAYRAIASRLHDAQLGLKDARPLKTFSATLPFGRIDHVFLSGHFEVTKVDVPRNDLTRVASDHLPLIVDLRFAPETAPSSRELAHAK